MHSQGLLALIGRYFARALVIDLVLASATVLVLWLRDRLTAVELESSLGALGLLAIAIGCLSLVGVMPARRPEPSPSTLPATRAGRLQQSAIHFLNKQMFLVTMLLIGTILIVIGGLIRLLLA